MEKSPQSVVILAAGQGKRMKSNLPKVLHEIGGQPLIFHTLHRVREVSPGAKVAVVVGHEREKVEAAIRAHAEFAAMDLTFVHQADQKGTGHAARCAMDSPWGEARVAEKALVLVLPGDLPLLTEAMIAQMLAPLQRAEALRLLTTELAAPMGYGRVVRRGRRGVVLRIVEERDANARERAIREVACSIYSFQAVFLRSALQRLSNKNAQGEYYLTDLVAAASRAKKRIDVLEWRDAEDLRGVNDPWELSLAGRTLNERVVRGHALAGVRFLDPSSTWVEVTVKLEPGAKIHPGVILQGATRVGAGAAIGAYCTLSDMEIGPGADVKTGTVGESSRILEGAVVGPYARLRPESVVGARAKIGNFVELKKARIGEKTSIAHLSYVGDADIGRDVNIGCGFITCNFDGRVIDGQRKHRTVIEDEVFLGSDCQTIAPVRIGKGAYVASGSTITEDVEPEALAIARARQVNKPEYARRLKPTNGKA
jgi:bifunctional UDP-N-acetylglucosamine pyrophosphorylase/glucosamine-1-phosphate N-acetyltransferase